MRTALGSAAEDESAVLRGRQHRPHDGTFSVPQSQKWFRRGTRHAPQHSDPLPRSPAQNRKVGPRQGQETSRGTSMPTARANMAWTHQPHRQGPESAPDSTLCSLGSEQGPSSASWGISQKPEHASGKDPDSCLLGPPNEVERQSGGTRAGAAWATDTGSAACRPANRHLHTPAPPASKCSFWRKCGATAPPCVVTLSVGHRRATGASGPGLPHVVSRTESALRPY